MLHKALTLFVVLLSITLSAQIPTGYYDPAIGKTGAELQTTLYSIINNHTVVSYTPGVWNAFYTTDDKPNGYVWDMYSDLPGGDPPYNYTFGSGQCGTSSQEGDCYSREHAFCQSYFAGASPMYSDLHHVFPVDQYVNNAGHSNHPFGTVTVPAYTSLNGSKRGPCTFPGYTGTVFEPIDEYKGDFARAYFYMATRYQDLIASWEANTPEGDAILNGTSYPAYESWFLNLLLTWNADDPVSTKEVDRNDAVYTIQNNRNPYIDHPEYVEGVWAPGGIKAEPTNHLTDLVSIAGDPGSSQIILNWTDATGAVLPDGYLIKGSTVSFADIADPVDGVAVADGGLNKNRIYGTETYTYNNLTASTTYYFKAYSYTNSGVEIDYKTDPVIPTATLATTVGTSVLQPGEIAFIGYGTDDPDKFAFVLLTDVAENTQITFTDNGWMGSVLRTGEQTGTWTAPTGGLIKGTVIVIQGTTVTGGGTMSSGLTGLSISGDQILAFQGTTDSPAFVAGISTTGWIDTGVPTSNESYLPAELTLFSSALGFTSEMDNRIYNGPLTLGNSTINAFISHPANWLSDNTIQTFPSWTFVIGTQTIINVNASVESITLATGETITVQENIQLTVTGTGVSK
jgi:endonuclease I